MTDTTKPRRGRPRLSEDPRVQVTVHVPIDLLRQLEDQAEATGRSRNQVLLDLLQAGLGLEVQS